MPDERKEPPTKWPKTGKQTRTVIDAYISTSFEILESNHPLVGKATNYRGTDWHARANFLQFALERLQKRLQ